MKILMFFLEILSIPLFLAFVPLYFLLRTLLRKSTEGFFIKSGFFKSPLEIPFKPVKEGGEAQIMFHGVSVGEVIALENLIKLTKETFPAAKIIVTTGTKTGQEIAHKKYGEIADFITYFPFDLPFCVKNFFKKIRPSIILMAETELWPSFAYYAHKKEIPLYLINGRISDDSFKTYKHFKFFFKQIFKFYTGIFTQSEDDKRKILEMGADEAKTAVMKNLKFDIKINPAPLDFEKGEEKIFIAGSTHKEEDPIIIDTYKNLKASFPSLKLLLAPRHLNRNDYIENLLNDANLKFGHRSKKETFKDNDVIILDTLGELSRMYSVADIAFIGGSFNNTGGHNPLEAVIYSIPVVSGPSIKNFKDIYGILTKTNAAKVVQTKEELEERLKKLLSDNAFYTKAKADCKTVFDNQQGAKDFVIEKIREILAS